MWITIGQNRIVSLAGSKIIDLFWTPAQDAQGVHLPTLKVIYENGSEYIDVVSYDHRNCLRGDEYLGMVLTRLRSALAYKAAWFDLADHFVVRGEQ